MERGKVYRLISREGAWKVPQEDGYPRARGAEAGQSEIGKEETSTAQWARSREAKVLQQAYPWCPRALDRQGGGHRVG